jgi:hypothetical protein
MNITAHSFEDGKDYTVSFRITPGNKEWSARSRRAGFGRRRGKGPVQFNGIHRRRQKRIRW